MPGYSGTPLAKKLGIKPRARVALVGVASDVRAELAGVLAQAVLVKHGKGLLDLVLFATKSEAELRMEFPKWMKRLATKGAVWISWPKKTSGVTSDLDENKVRALGLAIGLVDVKVCAVSEVWSGLKFVIPIKDRAKAKENPGYRFGA
jgi:hypothetical protein